MSSFNRPLRASLGAALLTVFVSLPALADDIEIYRGNTGARPNVLFVLDTSGSMDATVIQTPPAFNPSTTYTGSCVAGRIYFTTNNNTPSCGSNWFPETSNTCKASMAALVNIGGSGAWPALGNAREKVAQLRSSEWRSISNGNSGLVECEADDGVHGRDDASVAGKYIRNSSTGWSTSDREEWDDISNRYRLFTPNYLNYANGVGVPVSMTRLEIVRNVAITLASTLQNVNLGLMRYSTTAEGGYVLNAIDNIATNRTAILNTLNLFDPDDGSSFTPLSETYYEAARYFTGRGVHYGNTSAPGTSVSGSRVSGSPNTYKTPINSTCQKNFIVYLTDGAPTLDDDGNGLIETMIGGACAPDPIEPFHDVGFTVGSGVCMDDLANWLNTTDLSTSQAGDQTVQTYMIGFGSSVAASAGYLNTIAQAGGTEQAFTAGDVPTLTRALQAIFEGIQESSGTFITPSVSINAFNRAQASSDLFFSLFKVSAGPHWLGNVKKYELDGSTIRDLNGNNAVDSAGFFDANATSFWSPLVDGNDVTKGGAISQMPAPASRKIYSYLSTEKQLAHASGVNLLTATNTLITDAKVGTGTATAGCSALCADVVNWARGVDVRDRDRDGDVTEAFHFMGDPLHGRPALVGYGGSTSSPDVNDIVVYVPTNDGFLHAIDGRGRQSGEGGDELWAFIPPELLPRLHSLYENTTAIQRTYGLDSDVRVMKLDINQDGIVDPSDGDKVWLFFGMRMGGDRYYALDVTNRNSPTLMWSIGPAELPGLGQTWSGPVVTRVKVGTANDNAEKLVLIFGGGYDLVQEVQPYSADTVGNRIFMVDAETGDRLWYAGPSGTPTPDLVLSSMTNSIPGRITVIDTDGDLFADRMYAADMGGRVWRFDITNGNAAGSLVAGGVIAKLGAADNGTPPAADHRRFYNAPDVALVQRRRQQPFFNIAIGSGHRGRPLDTVTADRFYSIRDKQPYARLTQTQYNAITPIVETALRDITSDPMGIQVLPADPGWVFKLPIRTGHSGEKVLSESTTVNNVILFPTFQPLEPSATDPCFPTNVNRVYALSVDGKPALDFYDDSSTTADDGEIDNNDIFVTLNQTGIVGDINVALVRDDGETDGDSIPETVCLAGVEVLSKCVGVGGTIRTFWQRDDAD